MEVKSRKRNLERMEGLTLQNGHSTADRGIERCRITETTREKPITCLDSHEQALIA
jgi:hypothetical protein